MWLEMHFPYLHTQKLVHLTGILEDKWLDQVQPAKPLSMAWTPWLSSGFACSLLLFRNWGLVSIFSTFIRLSQHRSLFSEQFSLTESFPFAAGNCATSTEWSGKVYCLLFSLGNFGANWVLNTPGWKVGLKWAGERIILHKTTKQRSSWSRNAFWRDSFPSLRVLLSLWVDIRVTPLPFPSGISLRCS